MRSHGRFPEAVPGGMLSTIDFSKILDDPELMAVCDDIDVMVALREM